MLCGWEQCQKANVVCIYSGEYRQVKMFNLASKLKFTSVEVCARAYVCMRKVGDECRQSHNCVTLKMLIMSHCRLCCRYQVRDDKQKGWGWASVCLSGKHESHNNNRPQVIPVYGSADSLERRSAPERLRMEWCWEARPHAWMLRTGVFEDHNLPIFMEIIHNKSRVLMQKPTKIDKGVKVYGAGTFCALCWLWDHTPHKLHDAFLDYEK